MWGLMMIFYSSQRLMRKQREEQRWISASKVLLASTCFSTALIVSGAASMAQTISEQEQQAEADTIVLDQIVLTASSIATTLKEAPASISVVDQDQLQQRGAPDITEALRTVPGVNVGFDSSGTRGISIRGMGSAYTLLMVDGKRINAGLTTLRDYNGDLSWVPMRLAVWSTLSPRSRVISGPAR
jgi:outer membrane receptor for ferrienterochelin and colicin